MRQLQLLDELSRSGSVFHAAQALGMSQSAASRLLSSLESEMGVPLYERHARGVVATHYGEIVARRASSALAEIARAAAEVSELARGHRTPLSIGCLLSQSSTYLPDALLEITRVAPHILVQARIERSRPLIEGLLAARFDLVIARVRDVSLASDLAFESLGPEPVRVFARCGHPLARRRKLSFEEVAQYKWILPPAETDMRTRLDALCAQQGLPFLTGLLETFATPLILSVLRASDALVALPGEFARPFCEDGAIVQLRIELGVTSENVGIITRRHHAMSPALKTGLEIFRSVARNAYGAPLGGMKG